MGGRPRHDDARERPQGDRDDVHDAVGRDADVSWLAGPYIRNVWVYVPAGYVPGTILPLMIDHDGRADAVIQSQLIVVMTTSSPRNVCR
jgi:hypothetical protein